MVIMLDGQCLALRCTKLEPQRKLDKSQLYTQYSHVLLYILEFQHTVRIAFPASVRLAPVTGVQHPVKSCILPFKLI
jgi:hypothetical protein